MELDFLTRASPYCKPGQVPESCSASLSPCCCLYKGNFSVELFCQTAKDEIWSGKVGNPLVFQCSRLGLKDNLCFKTVGAISPGLLFWGGLLLPRSLLPCVGEPERGQRQILPELEGPCPGVSQGGGSSSPGLHTFSLWEQRPQCRDEPGDHSCPLGEAPF